MVQMGDIFLNEMALYLDEHFKLGRYLGASIDAAPSMTAKILTNNGQVLYRFAYLLLT